MPVVTGDEDVDHGKDHRRPTPMLSVPIKASLT